jgi:cytochrome c5
MAKQPQNHPQTSALEMVISVLGALLVLTAVSLLLIHLLNGIKDFTSDADKANDEPAVAERIKPVAQVEVTKASLGANGGKSGEAIVTAVCSACHATGALGAPKIGDKSAWGPRIAQGYKTLVKHANEGIRMMPAKGGNPDLSDEEIARAVAFMANKAGANFTAPKAVAQ